MTTDVYAASLPGTAASSRPAQLTYAQVAKLNGGRLPLGIRAPSETDVSVPADTVDVRYADTVTLTAWVEPRTGTVVDLRWQEAVRVSAINTPVGSVPLEEPIAEGTRAFPSQVAAQAATTAHQADQRRSARVTYQVGAWMAVIAAVSVALLAGALSMSSRRPRRPMVNQGESSRVV